MNFSGAGLYIHIPFCIKKCSYCDFLSFENQSNETVDAYFNALYSEIIYYGKSGIYKNFVFDSIYIGGGTPTSVPVKYIEKLLITVKNNFNISENSEITIEANPGTVNEQILYDLSSAGINRVSAGMQSSEDRILKSIGRIHDRRTGIESLSLISRYFTNFNIDFIFGIPDICSNGPQGIEDISGCLSIVKIMKPSHVSFYSLITEPGTKLYRLASDGKVKETDPDTERNMYYMICSELKESGYNHYEISNFSRPGFESKHNIKYWTSVPYLGLGLGASSYMPDMINHEKYLRFSNIRNLKEYIDNSSQCIYHHITEETQDIEARKKDYMLLGFRMLKGPDASGYYKLFGTPMEDDFRTEINKLRTAGLIADDFSLTQKGLDFANEIFIEFI